MDVSAIVQAIKDASVDSPYLSRIDDFVSSSSSSTAPDLLSRIEQAFPSSNPWTLLQLESLFLVVNKLVAFVSATKIMAWKPHLFRCIHGVSDVVLSGSIRDAITRLLLVDSEAVGQLMGATLDNDKVIEHSGLWQSFVEQRRADVS
jgi:hypothetical protein